MLDSINTAGSPLSDVKTVIYGNPSKIPESDLPAITIKPVGTDWDMRGSRVDEKRYNIEIRLVYNARDYYGLSKEDKDKVFVVEDSINKIEKSNDSLEVVSGSICGVIQNNQCLPYKEDGVTKYASTLTQIVSTRYEDPKDVSATREFPTYEAVVVVSSQSIGDR